MFRNQHELYFYNFPCLQSNGKFQECKLTSRVKYISTIPKFCSGIIFWNSMHWKQFFQNSELLGTVLLYTELEFYSWNAGKKIVKGKLGFQYDFGNFVVLNYQNNFMNIFVCCVFNPLSIVFFEDFFYFI